MIRNIDPARLSIGYLLPTRDAVVAGEPAGEPLLELGEQAEALGFDAIWVGDGPLARPRHDPLAMLAALAARTERVYLGTAVLIAALRPALLLAQTFSTIDQISEGRLVVGVGAGFPYPETERQFKAIGVPYRRRLSRMTETIGAMRSLWAAPGVAVDHEGLHFQLTGVCLEPPAFDVGGPPIWMAGSGEAAERRVGRLADGWLPYPPSADLYAEGYERVRASAAEAGRGRPPLGALYATVALDRSEEVARARLKKSIEAYYGIDLEVMSQLQAMYAGTPEGLVAWLGPYIDAGARHIVLRVSDDDAPRGLRLAAEARELAIDALGARAEDPV